jgi:L-iditol 2-dehydrogenase
MSTGMMKAAVLHAPGKIVCEKVSIPKINDGEVLIKVRAAGVCGSDIRRVMVTGTYHFPTIPGHEFSGEIVEVSKTVTKVKLGDRVTVFPLIPCRECEFCQVGNYNLCDHYNYLGSRTDGGFAEYVKAPEWNVLSIPDAVDFETAAATEPASVALHGLRQAHIQPGDTVAILGVGPIGLMVAQWARILGAKEIYLVDTLPEKLKLAQDLGFATENCFNSTKLDTISAIKEKTNGKGVSLAIESAGVPATFKATLEITTKGGRVLMLGNPSADVLLPVDLISNILKKQLSLHGTWNSEFRPIPLNEWEMSLKFMELGQLKIKPLISHRYALEDASEVFDMMFIPN